MIRLSAAVLSLYLAGCATVPPPEYGTRLPQRLPERVDLVEVPFHPQDRYQCGPAALATVLGSAGVERTPQQLEDEVYLPRLHGSLQPEMLGAARRAGVLPYRLEAQPNDLLREVAAGNPVVVLQNLRLDILPQWHYAVVVGYDLTEASIALRSGRERRLVMRIEDFDRSWARAGRWAFVALPPDRLPATAREADFVAAAADLERVSPANARRAYQTALGAWPQNLFARIALGNVAYRMRQLDVAQAEYRQATVDNPNAADAWNNLAQVLYETGKLREARDAAKRAVDIGGPRMELYASTLATIEAKVVR
jgi:tetratricopeptide (TPR) repeat protein